MVHKGVTVREGREALETDWESIAGLLEAAHGNPRHGNPENPLDCLIYLMLTRKTPITVGQRVFQRLRQVVPSWQDLLSMDNLRLEAVLAGSGLEATRAQHLRQVVQSLQDHFGTVTLDPLREWPDADCLRFLTSLPGVGAKTALCVMMYGLGRQVFPADAHCIRILQRMGVIPAHLQHRPAQRRLACLVPPNLAYKLHVNLVAHGQTVCRAARPLCGSCVIRAHCAYGQSELWHGT